MTGLSGFAFSRTATMPGGQISESPWIDLSSDSINRSNVSCCLEFEQLYSYIYHYTTTNYIGELSILPSHRVYIISLMLPMPSILGIIFPPSWYPYECIRSELCNKIICFIMSCIKYRSTHNYVIVIIDQRTRYIGNLHLLVKKTTYNVKIYFISFLYA